MGVDKGHAQEGKRCELPAYQQVAVLVVAVVVVVVVVVYSSLS